MTEKNDPSTDSIDAPPLAELIEAIDRETAAFPETATARDSEGEPTGADGAAPYIRFTLGRLLLAVPMAATLEIGQSQQIARLPNLPGWVLGVTNIRGNIVSVVDLKAFLGLGPASPAHGRGAAARQLILVRNSEMTVGLTVDRVEGLFHLDRRASIGPSPYKAGDPEETLARHIHGVLPPEAAGLEGETRRVNLLDVDRLLTSHRMTAFRAE